MSNSGEQQQDGNTNSTLISIEEQDNIVMSWVPSILQNGGLETELMDIDESVKFFESESALDPFQTPRPERRLVPQPEPASVQMLVQVQPRVRFRYPGDTEKRMNGNIRGANSTKKNKTYPTIKINHNNREDTIVVVSCVTKDKPHKVHPHNIFGGGAKNGLLVGRPTDNEFELTGIGIQCTKNENVALELQKRATVRVSELKTFNPNLQIDPFGYGFDHAEKISKDDLREVRLAVQVFVLNKQKTWDVLAPQVSDPIFDSNARSGVVKIMWTSDSSGTSAGNATVAVEMDAQVSKNIEVWFYEYNAADEVEWKESAKILRLSKKMIIFKTPPYDGMTGDTCFAVLSNNESSNKMPYQYITEDEIPMQPTPRNRKRVKPSAITGYSSCEDESYESRKSDDSGEDENNRSDRVESGNSGDDEKDHSDRVKSCLSVEDEKDRSNKVESGHYVEVEKDRSDIIESDKSGKDEEDSSGKNENNRFDKIESGHSGENKKIHSGEDDKVRSDRIESGHCGENEKIPSGEDDKVRSDRIESGHSGKDEKVRSGEDDKVRSDEDDKVCSDRIETGHSGEDEKGRTDRVVSGHSGEDDKIRSDRIKSGHSGKDEKVCSGENDKDRTDRIESGHSGEDEKVCSGDEMNRSDRVESGRSGEDQKDRSIRDALARLKGVMRFFTMRAVYFGYPEIRTDRVLVH